MLLQAIRQALERTETCLLPTSMGASTSRWR